MSGELRMPLLQAEAVGVQFALRREGVLAAPRMLRALAGVDLRLSGAEALGIVGESGSGKSTLARALLRLLPLCSGRVLLRGEDLALLPAEELRARRQHMQMIFQDPFGSLDPRMNIERIVGEPLATFEPGLTRAARRERVVALLERVGLTAAHLARYPHQFSGGQAQRIGIARALSPAPRLLVCDEPVASLDVALRAQVIDLLAQLRTERSLALIFIAHDLAAVRTLCERVMVLYLGRVMESAATASLFASPRHPYTRALLAAAPLLDPRRARLRRAAQPPVWNEAPSPLAPPSGCVFRTRCPHAIARCERELPLLRSVGGSEVACHRAEDLAQQSGA